MPEDNLLLVLNKWAVQDENFTTDAFAHVLRHLLKHAPGVGVDLVSCLCGPAWTPSQADAQAITVNTQVTLADGGCPDIEIRAPEHLVYVEAKVSAPLNIEQLISYRKQLDLSGVTHTALVFLSQYLEYIPEEVRLDAAVRWNQIGEWLDNWLEQGRISDSDTTYLATQFTGYLRGRNMTMEKVGYELGKGIESLFNLLAMMGEALQGKVTVRFASWQIIAFNISKAKYYLYIDWRTPQFVKFYTACPINKEQADALGFGQTYVDGISRWRHELDLASAEVHFYALSKADQMQCIQEFVQKCLQAAESITLPDAAPVPSPLDQSA
jgi:hypothetical protein